MGRPLGTRPRTWAATIAAATLLAGCSAPGTEGPGSEQSAQPPSPQATVDTTAPPAPTASETAASEPRLAPDGRPFVVTEVAEFDEPWAMAFLPGTPWLAITERTGTLHLRDQESGRTLEVSGVPEVVVGGQGGLGDIVAGPTFADDNTVYLSWIERGDGGTGAVVGRARLVVEGDTARLDGLTTVWEQTPKVSGNGHFSHRLAFSPDGQYLFVSSGDRQKMEPAQDLSNTLGTIVRLTPDGEPAPGNPFADRGAPTDQIWSYGHRNPLGLAFDEAGRLWSSEMGPQGGDEINLIEAGANYGWPEASNGSHYGGGEIPDHADGDGFAAPKVGWTPSVSPGSLMIYHGDAFPDWTGDAFVGALSGQALIRVDLDGESATEGDLWEMGQRIRAVAEAPDGSIWLLEDAPGGRLLQLTAP
ncbi:MAG: PQQ-dependent sugar dehydrogenase [Propionibacteriaceae bacterium]|nr:PQQ-dependent sugar dehydrogenase [Propionibacteriaceae bacterium]